MPLLLFVAAAILTTAADHEADSSLTLALVVQGHPSQQKTISKHSEAIHAFLDTLLRPGDKVSVVSVDKAVKLVLPLTTSRQELGRILGAAIYGNPHGSTLADPCQGRKRCQPSPNEAVAATAKQLDSQPGRKVVLILGDESVYGLKSIPNHAATVFFVSINNECSNVRDVLKDIGEQVNLLRHR